MFLGLSWDTRMWVRKVTVGCTFPNGHLRNIDKQDLELSMTNSSTLAIPETFPAVLKSFTREILRDSEKQDARSIHAFGFKYFQSLIAERDGLEIVETPTKTETTSPMYVQLKSDRELQTLVLEAFQELDGGLVHASVVMPVFMTLASTLGEYRV